MNSSRNNDPQQLSGRGPTATSANSGTGSAEPLEQNAATASEANRRGFMSTCANLAMAGGLAAGYGTLGYCAIRFLSPPADNENMDWQFVGTLASLEGKPSLEYTAASGVRIILVRVQADAAEFIALSNVCPHLGCQVFWEAVHDRFFCPCHNGTFDASGEATGGPPADAGQSLTRYETRIVNDALYVLAPLKTVTDPRRKM